MKKILLPIVLVLLGFVLYKSFEFVTKSAYEELLSQQYENSKIQAEIVSNMLSQRIAEGESLVDVKKGLQNSIENMSTENSFVCMFDNTGQEICHPKTEKIGKSLDDNNSIIRSISNFDKQSNFKKSILEKKSIGGIRELKEYTELVYLSPVKNADWIVASHVNMFQFETVINKHKEKIQLLFFLIWLASSLIIFLLLYYINLSHIKKTRQLNSETSHKYFNDLKNIEQLISTNEPIEGKEVKRLLTDKGSKLTPVLIKDIALVYTENKITYIKELNGNTSTINSSLDDLFSIFDKHLFYRASRQVILSINAIDKIEKYGKMQLRVISNPTSPVEIIISKIKLTDFKKWVGKN